MQQLWKTPGLGQVVVDDLGHGQPDQRQEDPLGRLADRAVLLRRAADDDRLEDRVGAHGHRLDPHERERLDRRVEAGVVAERALGQPRARLDPALEDDLRGGGHLQRHGQAVDQFDPFALHEPGEQVLVDLGRQRGARGVGDRRRAAERDRDRQPLAAPLGDRGVRGRVLVDLPVQADRARVLLLQPVHAEVAGAGLRMLGVGQAEVEEDPAVVRPGLDAGQPVEVDLVARVDHLLARAPLTCRGGTARSWATLPSASRRPPMPRAARA